MNEQTIFIINNEPKDYAKLQYLFEPLKIETYGNASQFLKNYRQPREGCLLLSMKNSISPVLEFLNKLTTKLIYLPVIVMSPCNEIPMIVKIIQAGAVDFIHQSTNEKYLVERVHYHLKNFSKKFTIDFHLQKNILTQREQEVMNLILDSKFNKEIAYELSISVSTVEAHRARIMSKFNAKNLAQLIKNYFHIPDYLYK